MNGERFITLEITTSISEQGKIVFNAKITCNGCATYIEKNYKHVLEKLNDYTLKDGTCGFSFLWATFETDIDAFSKEYVGKVLFNLGEMYKSQHPNKHINGDEREFYMFYK